MSGQHRVDTQADTVNQSIELDSVSEFPLVLMLDNTWELGIDLL